MQKNKFFFKYAGIRDCQRLFLKQLAIELITCHTLQHMNNPRVPRSIRSSLKRSHDMAKSTTEAAEPESTEPPAKMTFGRREHCPRTLDRKTRFRCMSCNKWLSSALQQLVHRLHAASIIAETACTVRNRETTISSFFIASIYCGLLMVTLATLFVFFSYKWGCAVMHLLV